MNQQMFINSSKSSKTPQYIVLLSMLYVTAFIFPMMLAYRMVQLGPLLLPGGTLFFVASYFFGDVIAEVYGYQLARQLVWSAILCQLILGLFIMAVLHLPEPSYWHHEADFNYVLGDSFRYALASTVGNFFGEFTNIYLISKFKILTKGRYFWLRSLGATFCGEGVLTVIVFFITFFHVTSSDHMIDLILSGYLFKLSLSVLGVFPASLLVNYLKKSEGIDVYDYSTSFNPFKFSVNSADQIPPNISDKN